MKEHEDNSLSRRQFLLASALAGGGLMLPISATTQNSMPMQAITPPAPDQSGPADVTLHIGPVLVEVTKDKTISTVGYNGQVPGRLIRMQEGKPRSQRSTSSRRSAPWNGSTHPGYSGGRALTSSNCLSSSWVSVSSIAARLSSRCAFADSTGHYVPLFIILQLRQHGVEFRWTEKRHETRP
jgi:hypothetical protein